MASVRQLGSDKWQVQVRRSGLKPSTKSFENKVDAYRDIPRFKARRKSGPAAPYQGWSFVRRWKRAGSLEYCWRRTVKVASIEDSRFHDLRHEAVSRLFELGLNPMEVARISGHKTPQMLKRYTHQRASDWVKKPAYQQPKAPE